MQIRLQKGIEETKYIEILHYSSYIMNLKFFQRNENFVEIMVFGKRLFARILKQKRQLCKLVFFNKQK